MTLPPTSRRGLLRHGICAVALAACLTTAATVQPTTASAGDADPGPSAPQARPRGVPDLELPNLLRDGSGQGKAGDHSGPGFPGGPSYQGVNGIPATALDAYQKAEQALAASQPQCHLPWQLIAGIGRVESVHASGYGLRADGTTAMPIRGPRLDGGQFALIRDTDGGRWDGDAAYDRAVGPLQFIPSTWATWGADGNHDNTKDPNNLYDAALGTGRYLCAGERDLSDPADLDRAVLSYNNSRAYVTAVLQWMRTYRSNGAAKLPDNLPTTPHRPDPTARLPRPGGPADTAVRTTPAPAGRRSLTTAPRPVPPGAPAHLRPQPPALRPAAKPQPTPARRALARLDRIGPEEIKAQTERTLRPLQQIVARDVHGTPIPGIDLRLALTGDAAVRFLGPAARPMADASLAVTVRTNHQGIANVPAFTTGTSPGTATLRATAPGAPGPAVTFTITVRPAATPAADCLIPLDAAEITVPVDTAATSPLRIKATQDRTPAAGARVEAVILSSAGGSTPTEDGPYFEDRQHRRLRTLVLPPADAEGVIPLPALHAGRRPGSYLLRLTTPAGVRLDIPVTVTAEPAAPVHPAPAAFGANAA
ncbi:hypothetical protein DF17_27560 [Streptomyces rimosus]|nr:hypothetical protein DF17_27560 [Streptomyces rimosus]